MSRPPHRVRISSSLAHLLAQVGANSSAAHRRALLLLGAHTAGYDLAACRTDIGRLLGEDLDEPVAQHLATLYGARGLVVPILTPWQILQDIHAAPVGFTLALLAQGVLSVAQYGCPELARDDRRWWAGYVLTLGLSIYWNILGYGAVFALMGVPWLIAIGIIVAGDVAPEIAAKRYEG
ncbi:hypothetical protein [Candidatus Viridilinea mediisalina]|uniref:Uncharacterized protein n=1 Tax=Candidatus Viridilinea mediisalina TaxID=2024553 RepID=A0A2A6RI94_9CHLR|nr:hypothetical protein [Candidatus Viridilinea mediisalina]PDW02605.1 hypothetical protein CJ255_13030 [Candidatus Viridilinea mediisalina]